MARRTHSENASIGIYTIPMIAEEAHVSENTARKYVSDPSNKLVRVGIGKHCNYSPQSVRDFFTKNNIAITARLILACDVQRKAQALSAGISSMPMITDGVKALTREEILDENTK